MKTLEEAGWAAEVGVDGALLVHRTGAVAVQVGPRAWRVRFGRAHFDGTVLPGFGFETLEQVAFVCQNADAHRRGAVPGPLPATIMTPGVPGFEQFGLGGGS